jgi:hypothetical protein
MSDSTCKADHATEVCEECGTVPRPTCQECGEYSDDDGVCGECATCKIPLCCHGTNYDAVAHIYDTACDRWEDNQPVKVAGASSRVIRERLAERATITLRCDPDELEIRGNASAIDDKTDRETEAWIAGQLRDGNEWAWCVITVTATWRGFTGADVMGACSYESEASFRECCYDAMVATAIESLASQLEKAHEVVSALILGGAE